MNAPRKLDQNDPRFRRMRCDCCPLPVVSVVGDFPYYVCAGHETADAETLRSLYDAKHGCLTSAAGR